MTAEIVFTTLKAHAWCAILLVAFYGWGCLVLRTLTREVSSVGLAASVGLACAVVAGGVLNLLHLLYGPVLIGFTLAGVALAVLQLIHGHRVGAPIYTALSPLLLGGSKWQRLLLLGFVLLLAFRLTSAVRNSNYNLTDDETFYIPLPIKMMEMHHFASDPFSERRLESSLGGSYFLQCLVLSVLAPDNLQMADRYIGLVLIVLAAAALARQFLLSPWETTVLLVFAVAIPPSGTNLTFTVVPSALVLAIVLVATEQDFWSTRPVARAFLIGLLAGTLCCLKSIYLPPAVLFCFAIYFIRGFQDGWGFAVKGWLSTALGAMTVLLPWMVAMRLMSGTLLYPLFGPGYDFPAYHQFPVPYSLDPVLVLRMGAIYLLPLAALLMCQCFLFHRGERSFVLFSMTAACVLGIMASGMATGACSLHRYTFPFAMPAILLGYLQISWERHLHPHWKIGPLLQGSAIAALALWTDSYRVQFEYSIMADGFAMNAQPLGWDSAATHLEYEKISAALPKDGRILTTLQHPYLLDRLDQQILLADWPGCASPPPGWPIHQDGEALAKFLLSQSVRYLAYTYSDNAQLAYSYEGPGAFDIPSVWLGLQENGYLLAHRQYIELRQTRKTIYDDGKTFILDLATPAGPST